MKLFRLPWRRKRRRRQLPQWATENATEATIIRREAAALIAESRSHEWAQANTGLLRTIHRGLQRLDASTDTSAESTSWIIATGQRVAIGDTVMVDLGSVAQGLIEATDPEHHLPLVRITLGPQPGRLLRLTPAQIMLRRQP